MSTSRAAARRDGSAPADLDLRARVQQVSVRQQRFERQLAEALATDRAGLEAMDHLVSVGPLTPTELAGRLEISTAAMSLVLNRLEKAGHVRRSRHPDDGRKLVVTASAASAERAHRLLEGMVDDIETLIAGYDAEQQRVIQGFLDELLTIYDRATEHARATPEDTTRTFR